MKNVAVPVMLMLLAPVAQGNELDLSFNDDAVRLNYVRDYPSRDLQADLGILNNSDKGTVINASLYVQGLAADGLNPPQAGLGVRTGYVDGDLSDQSGIPVAIGGFLTYTLPRNNRISIRADAWIAPDILTLSDLDNYQDVTLRLQYEVLRTADVYVGARYVKAEFDNGTEARLDNGMNIGLKFRF